MLSKEECEEILTREPRGVLALLGDYDYPYALPMSHVYVDGKIYFHGAMQGHKNKFFPTHDETVSEIERLLHRTEVFEITIEHMSGKTVVEK